MGHIPGIEDKPLLKKKWFIESLAVVPPIVLAIGTAWINFLDPKKFYPALALVFGIMWLILASVAKVQLALSQDREDKKKANYDGLLGSLHVLYKCVTIKLNFVEKDLRRIRITIFRVVPNAKNAQSPEQLEQLLSYIGGDGGSAGRVFSIRSGVIGRAVRERRPLAFSRKNDDYEAYYRELISNWSYTEYDAKNVTRDCMAWMAVPITGVENKVIAVVYLDANENTLFTPEVKKIVINSCIGIASYINDRYR